MKRLLSVLILVVAIFTFEVKGDMMSRMEEDDAAAADSVSAAPTSVVKTTGAEMAHGATLSIVSLGGATTTTVIKGALGTIECWETEAGKVEKPTQKCEAEIPEGVTVGLNATVAGDRMASFWMVYFYDKANVRIDRIVINYENNISFTIPRDATSVDVYFSETTVTQRVTFRREPNVDLYIYCEQSEADIPCPSSLPKFLMGDGKMTCTDPEDPIDDIGTCSAFGNDPLEFSTNIPTRAKVFVNIVRQPVYGDYGLSGVDRDYYDNYQKAVFTVGDGYYIIKTPAYRSAPKASTVKYCPNPNGDIDDPLPC